MQHADEDDTKGQMELELLAHTSDKRTRAALRIRGAV